MAKENQVQTTDNNSLTLRRHYETQLREAKEYNSIQQVVKTTLMMENKSIRVGEIIRNGGKDLILLHVTDAIANFVIMLPPQRGVSTEAVIQISKAFTELHELKHLSIDELKTFLSLALKKMKFGKLYAGFGYDTLIEWFNAYFEERTEEVIRFRQEQHSNNSANEKTRRERSDGGAFGTDVLNILKNKGNE
jgi:hypothetical protein